MIRDKTARRIASSWIDGGNAFHVLSSTGAIDTGRYDHNLKEEIEIELEFVRRDLLRPQLKRCMAFTRQDERDLVNLLAYVEAKGTRGPVDGWNQISW